MLVRTGAGLFWLAYAVLMTGCFAATFYARFVRRSIAVTFFGVVALATSRFPQTANHLFLQCFVALLLAITNPEDEDEARGLVSAVRTILVGVFFWSGAQKLVHGAYFDGSFLCWNLVKGTHAAWRSVATIVLPAADLASAARAPATNECRFSTPIGLVLANSVYVSEIACAAVLLHPRLRARGAIAVAVVLVAIELVMSEWVFAAFAANMLLLFAAPHWARRARPVFLGWAVLVALLSGRP